MKQAENFHNNLLLPVTTSGLGDEQGIGVALSRERLDPNPIVFWPRSFSGPFAYSPSVADPGGGGMGSGPPPPPLGPGCRFFNIETKVGPPFAWRPSKLDTHIRIGVWNALVRGAEGLICPKFYTDKNRSTKFY